MSLRKVYLHHVLFVGLDNHPDHCKLAYCRWALQKHFYCCTGEAAKKQLKINGERECSCEMTLPDDMDMLRKDLDYFDLENLASLVDARRLDFAFQFVFQ